MSGVKQRLIGLCLPPLAFFAIDMTMTLHGQPAEYWAGNYAKAVEASPTLGNLLRISPQIFLLGCGGIALLTVTGILLLPEPLALIASIAGVMGGTYGASTWLLYGMHMEYGYQWMNLLLTLAAVTLGLSIRYGWRARPEEEYRLPIRPLWRWILAATLAAIAVWIALRPPTF